MKKSIEWFFLTLARLTKNVLAISISDVEIEKLFNQDRDIIHYRQNRFYAITIKMIIMLCMHTSKNSSMILNNEKNKKIKQQKIHLNENISTFSKLDENFFEDDNATSIEIAIKKKKKRKKKIFKNKKNKHLLLQIEWS